MTKPTVWSSLCDAQGRRETFQGVQILDDLEWKLLVDRIADGRCVPILGAAVNVTDPERGYSGLPLAADVALALAEQAWPHDEAIRREVLNATLAEVALAVAQRGDRRFLLNRVRDLLDDKSVEPSPLLRTLAELPLKLIVTTNYDRLLERALREAGQEPLVVSQAPAGFAPEAIRDLEVALLESRGVVVYKLHGSFQDDDTDEIVIDEDDYISMMGAIATGHGLPRSFMAQLVDSVLLCLGYSARDWDFRMLIGQLQRNRARRAYAVMRSSPAFWVRYLESRDFSVVDAHIYDFADQLAARWAGRGR